MSTQSSGNTNHLVFCFDAKFSNFASVAIASALAPVRENPPSARPVIVHCVVASDDLQARLAVERLQDKFGARVLLATIDLPETVNWKQTHYFSRAMYLRLFACEVVPADRAIYLDSDVLVMDSLDLLYDTDLAGGLLAGATDDVQSPISRAPDDPYLNSGVLLMDLDAMRREGFAKRCVQAYDRYHDQIIYPDQCLINKVAEGRKVVIDRRWNYRLFSNNVAPLEWINAQQQASVLHFFGGMKPWMPLCNPLVANLWWSVAKPLCIEGLERPQLAHISDPLGELGVEFSKLNTPQARLICDMLSYASILEVNGDHALAGRVKNDVICELFKNGIPRLN